MCASVSSPLRFAIVLAASAVTAHAWQLDLQQQFFTWDETDDGRTIVEESGPLYGLGVTHVAPLADRWDVALRIHGYLGEIDYDGETVGGDPSTTTTRYIGAETGADARYWIGDATRWAPLAGLAGFFRERGIDNSNRFRDGYDERWASIAARLGARAEIDTAVDVTLHAEAAAVLPLLQRVAYNLSDSGESGVTVEPGRRTGLRLSAGAAIGPWSLAIAHEVLAYGRSEDQSLGRFLVYQPESDEQRTTLQLSAEF